MSSITSVTISHQVSRLYHNAPKVDASGVHKIIRLFIVIFAAACLAACAQSSVATRKSEFAAAGGQSSVESSRRALSATTRRAAVAKRHTPVRSDRSAAETQIGSRGMASFYTEGGQTASGERFDTHQLTAAHPTLPFGTRLRVTNVVTGRSVTVRVNDRGPFVPGRVVDVSYSAAEALGMVRGGTAPVKLDVVE